jgi:hypothetical protein
MLFRPTLHHISWDDEIKKNKTDGECGTYGGEERCIHDFGGETRRKWPLGRPRHRWKDTVKMYLKWDVQV